MPWDPFASIRSPSYPVRGDEAEALMNGVASAPSLGAEDFRIPISIPISAPIGSAAELRAVVGENISLAAVEADLAATHTALGDDAGLEYALRRAAYNPESLWNAYVAAAERSKRTLALRDGIAAGKAYACFVESFVEPNRRGHA